MNKILAVIIVIAVAAVTVCAAVTLMDGNKNDVIKETDGPQLNVMKNISDNLFDLYLAEKDSSNMTPINDGGKFAIPDNPVIVMVAKNPSGDLGVKEKKVILPTSSDTYYVAISFDKGTWDTPVLKGSDTAYIAFAPGAVSIVDLGVFVTNYDS